MPTGLYHLSYASPLRDSCRTILVTGATGFTGSHVVRRLVSTNAADGWLAMFSSMPSNCRTSGTAVRDCRSAAGHSDALKGAADCQSIVSRAQPPANRSTSCAQGDQSR